MENDQGVNHVNDEAECCACGDIRQVCCDHGYRDMPDGTREHDDPYCADCCGCHQGRLYCGGGSYERADCDQ